MSLSVASWSWRLLLALQCLCGSLATGQLPPTPASATLPASDYTRWRGEPYHVRYDNQSLIIDEQRLLLLSGSVHYPRSTPGMWPQLLQSVKAADLNMVETYVFWDLHEPDDGIYDFAALTTFLQAASDAGLFVMLRIGPYICAERNFGGIPAWLKEHQHDIRYRSIHPVWTHYMERFVRRVVEVVEPYLPRNGGPIVVAQIENEFGEREGDAGVKYVQWCADLTESLHIEVPWIMCEQHNAPTNILVTTNGFYSDSEAASTAIQSRLSYQPLWWTEAWTGWFYAYGEGVPHRPSSDVAYATVNWIASGGSMLNYYMWHGGTNFGRTSAGPHYTTSYDYDAPIDEYGQPHPTKYSHLQKLHQVIRQHEADILGCSLLGRNLPTSPTITEVCGPITLLVNNQYADSARLQVAAGVKVDVAPRAALIVDTTTHAVLFDSDQIDLGQRVSWLANSYWVTAGTVDVIASSSEPVGATKQTGIDATANELTEQLSLTKDTTDYLWYSTDLHINTEDFERNTMIMSMYIAQDVTHVYIDEHHILTTRDHSDAASPVTYQLDLTSVDRTREQHQLHLLNVVTGISTGAYEDYFRGVRVDLRIGKESLARSTWNYRIGLQQEQLTQQRPALAGTAWSSIQSAAVGADASNVMWYRLDLHIPVSTCNGDLSSCVWRLDLTSLHRGSVWVNGYAIGRHNTRASSVNDGSCQRCVVKSPPWGYNSFTCRTDCGQPSQSHYHVPAEWLRAGSPNEIVVLEELAQDVNVEQISIQWQQRYHYSKHSSNSDRLQLQ